jgi:AraC-like DNA-binding protein
VVFPSLLYLSLILSLCLFGLLAVALFKEKTNSTTKQLLLTLVPVKLLEQFTVLVTISGSIERYPLLIRSGFPLELGSIPLVYLYIRSLVEKDFKLKDANPWHLLPFALGLVWYLIVLAIGPASLFRFSPEFHFEKYWRLAVVFLVTLPYIWFSRRKILQLRAEAKDFNSSLAELRLPWLNFLLFVCYFTVVFRLGDLLSGPQAPLWIYSGLITTVALMGLIYFALSKSLLLQREFTPSNGKVLEDGELERLKARLLLRLEHDRLYLQPQIRLNDLADTMSVKGYRLSEVIKRGLGTTFYDLINGLRVEHAKQILLDPAYVHLNLLGVAMESGFNSKSAFNDAFKRKLGLTPSEYRAKEKGGGIS